MNARELGVSVYRLFLGKGGKQRRKKRLGFVCFKRPHSFRNTKNFEYIFTPSESNLSTKFDVDSGIVIDDKTWRMI